MTTGMMRPAISLFWVRALNCLQNSMMLTWAWPSAGPTGGAGVALPASICSLTCPVIFFGGAMKFPSETSFQLLAVSFLLVIHLFNFGAVSSVRSQPEACQAGHRLEAE